MDKRAHWETLYLTKRPDAMSWYQPSLHVSLDLIRKAGIPKDAAILDVGGGSSTLVDDLLSAGYSDITVLDISRKALDNSMARLGPRAASAQWIAGDILLDPLPPSGFDLWHDRALFHFLVSEDERRRYCSVLYASVRPDGFAIIATFGPNGPVKCSGLEIVRYSAEALLQTVGGTFRLVSNLIEHHVTPSHSEQEFSYCLLQKVGRGNR